MAETHYFASPSSSFCTNYYVSCPWAQSSLANPTETQLKLVDKRATPHFTGLLDANRATLATCSILVTTVGISRGEPYRRRTHCYCQGKPLLVEFALLTHAYCNAVRFTFASSCCFDYVIRIPSSLEAQWQKPSLVFSQPSRACRFFWPKWSQRLFQHSL